MMAEIHVILVGRARTMLLETYVFDPRKSHGFHLIIHHETLKRNIFSLQVDEVMRIVISTMK
jgi:hypothetical protein